MSFDLFVVVVEGFRKFWIFLGFGGSGGLVGGGFRLLIEGRGFRRGLRFSFDFLLGVSVFGFCCLVSNFGLSGNLGLLFVIVVGSEFSDTELGSRGFLGRFSKNLGCGRFLSKALVSGCENLRGGFRYSICRKFLGSRLNSGFEDVLGRSSCSGWGRFLESGLKFDCRGFLGSVLISGFEDVLERLLNLGCGGFLGRLFS